MSFFAHVKKPDAPETNPWKTLSSEVKYNNRWIRVVEDQVINPAGTQGIYGKVHFHNTAIGIVPLDQEQHTWLVGQFRYVFNAWSWEIPEGGGGKDTPLAAAQRELREETGLTADQWTELGCVHLSNSVSDEIGYLFLAESLREGESEREATEADMKVWRLPFKEAYYMVERGEITDSLSVIGILKVARLLNI